MAETNFSRFKYPKTFKEGDERKLPLDLPQKMKSADLTVLNDLLRLRQSYNTDLNYYNPMDTQDTLQHRQQYVNLYSQLVGIDNGTSEFTVGSNPNLELTMFNARKYNLLADMTKSVRQAAIDRINYYVQNKLNTYLYYHADQLIDRDNASKYTSYDSDFVDSMIEQTARSTFWKFTPESEFKIDRTSFIQNSTYPIIDGVIVYRYSGYCVLSFADVVPDGFVIDENTECTVYFKDVTNNSFDIRVDTQSNNNVKLTNAGIYGSQLSDTQTLAIDAIVFVKNA